MGWPHRNVGLQLLENKALSWGVIRRSACILAEITIRKSHPLEGSCQEARPLPCTPRSRGQAKPHDFYLGGAFPYCCKRHSAMMRSERLRQEVHHGSVRAGDASHSTFAFGPGRLTTSGGRDRHREPHRTPPATCALNWAWGRSPGPGDSRWGSCAVQGGATARRARDAG